jgi:hypothetical protein
LTVRSTGALLYQYFVPIGLSACTDLFIPCNERRIGSCRRPSTIKPQLLPQNVNSVASKLEVITVPVSVIRPRRMYHGGADAEPAIGRFGHTRSQTTLFPLKNDTNRLPIDVFEQSSTVLVTTVYKGQ